MLIFFMFIFENLQLSKASEFIELQLNSSPSNLGHRSILLESESKYFLGTSKNISSKIDTEYLLLYSISTNTDASIFDPIYIKNINPPPLRKYYGIFFGDKEVYIYGGASNSKVFNDFWKYNIETGLWTEITHLFTKFGLPPMYEFGYTSFKAGYYNHHGITYNYMMIAGGIDDQGKFKDKVWVFYFNKKIDEKITNEVSFNSITNCANGPLAGLKIIRYNYYFYIFSGYRKQNDTDNTFYQFENICFLNFVYTHNWFYPNQNFVVYKPTSKQIGLFNQNFMDGSTIYQFFGIEYINEKAVFNTAIYSLNINDLNKGWTKHANLDIKAHSFSLVKKQNYVYLVEGDALSSYQINYPLMNSTLVLKSTPNPQKKLNLIRLGNELYLYNNSLFKIKPLGYYRNSFILIQDIKNLNKGPLADEYLYSSEGDILLITEYISKKTGFNNPSYINIGVKFWLFNHISKIWISYNTSLFIPFDLKNTCSILKYPFIILLGKLGTGSDNLFENYKQRIYILNTVNLSYKLFDLEFYSEDIVLNCQVLKTYQSFSSKIPEDVIELLVIAKNSDGSKKIYKFDKLIISEQGITQKKFIENLKDINIPSNDYFLVDTDEVYFFDFYPRNFGSEEKWWENTTSIFTKGEGRIVHYANVATDKSSIEVLNNRLYVISGKTNDRITGDMISSDYFYESDLQDTSLIRSCDYGYTMVSGFCQPCDIGTYNDNKVKGLCVPCNTILNTTSDIGSWSSSQCTNLLDYTSDKDKNIILEALGFNRTESLMKDDQSSDNNYRLIVIFIVTFITSLLFIKPLQVLLSKLDYFQFNAIKTKKRVYKIERLTKKLAYYSNENQNNESWANHKRQNINEKIEIIRRKVQDNKNFGKFPKLKGFLTGLVLLITILIASAVFFGFYYNKESIKKETLSISEYEAKHGKIESVVKISVGIFPADQKLCELDLNLNPGIFNDSKKNPKYLNDAESHSFYLETDEGGACIINFKVNLAEPSQKFRAELELLSRRMYAKNLFFYVQSYNENLEYSSNIFKTFQSSEGESFSEKIKLEITLNQKAFIEDYFYNPITVLFNSIDKDSFFVDSETILDDYLPLGSRMIFEVSIVWKETAEVSTTKLLSNPDYNLILLLVVIVLVHEGLRSCAFKIVNWLENLKKNKELDYTG